MSPLCNGLLLVSMRPMDPVPSGPFVPRARGALRLRDTVVPISSSVVKSCFGPTDGIQPFLYMFRCSKTKSDSVSDKGHPVIYSEQLKI